MSCRNARAPALDLEAERAWIADLVDRAFPGFASEEAQCVAAAEVLTSAGRPCHPRTVRNWKRRVSTPHFRYVLALIALAGVERLLDHLDPERSAR